MTMAVMLLMIVMVMMRMIMIAMSTASPYMILQSIIGNTTYSTPLHLKPSEPEMPKSLTEPL